MVSRNLLRPHLRASRCFGGRGIHHQSCLRMPVVFRSANPTIPGKNSQRSRIIVSVLPKLGPAAETLIPRIIPPIIPPATLKINGNNLKSFLIEETPDFSHFRQSPGQAYFDRTQYIPTLNQLLCETILFLRPPAFGKSLTISMLEYFHGLQHKDKYQAIFKDLDIDKAVRSGLATPGEYLILRFDFSGVQRNPNLEVTAQGVGSVIINGVKDFYNQYHAYLGQPAKNLIFEKVNVDNPIYSLNELVKFVSVALRKAKEESDEANPLVGAKGIYLLVDEYDAFTNKHLDSWVTTQAPALVKNFWGHVKYLKTLQFSIRKCFITGVTPLPLEETKGSPFAKDVSFHPKLAGMCGLTHSDVQAALENICDSKTEVEKHFGELNKYANGYQFCTELGSVNVFNTGTCLEYLRAVLEKTPASVQDSANSANSEVSKSLLSICAYSPVAMGEIENALATEVEPNSSQQPIFYSDIDTGFTPTDLYSKAVKNPNAWRKLLLYFGGLTYDKENPQNLLKIPNVITARRFGETILDRFSSRKSIETAVANLESSGNILEALACYRELMSRRDRAFGVYDWDEEAHRDSFHISVLSNPGLATRPGYKVTTPEFIRTAGKNPRVDLLVTTQTHLIYTHWETIGIGCLDINGAESRPKKLQILSEFNIDQLLHVRFNDLWYRRRYLKRMTMGKSIRGWLDREVSVWMRGYVRNRRVAMCGERKFLAYLILVVGSRQILVWELDEDGDLTNVRHLL